MELFYTPEYAKAGDVIPFYNEETRRFEGYYLKNWNPDAPKDKVIRGWHRIVTTDNRNFEEEPVHIDGGTGSVIRVNGIYHMFYCTFDNAPAAQWARHAVSRDLIRWTDIPEEKFGPDGEIYRTSDWRDPFVFWNEEEQAWWMLLAARENAATERNGCVALCTSGDLVHWNYQKPLYSPHEKLSAYECPDFFRMGDWYYLIYSNYTDGFQTYYRMSRSPRGPWIRPLKDTFDGRAFYAAKTMWDGRNRYLYGWNPTRGEDNWGFDPEKDYGKDYKTYNWGGSIVAHRLHQHEDGTLGTGPAEGLESAFSEFITPEIRTLTGDWRKTEDGVICRSQGGYSAALSQQIPDQCVIRARVSYSGSPSGFGLALHVDERFDFGYYLIFQPERRRIEFRSGLRMYEQGGQMFPYAVELERPIQLEAGREYQLELFIDGSAAVLYVDQDTALSFRMYQYRGRHIGWFAADGDITVKDFSIGT